MKTNTNKIRERRVEIGLTLKEVANALGTAESTISRYESINITSLSVDKIQELARVLACTPEYLVGWGQRETDFFDNETDFVDNETERLISMYDSLNETGKQLLLIQSNLLASSPKYKKIKKTEEKYMELVEKQSK